MLLAAGEVLHCGAEALSRERAHVHLQAFQPISHAGLVHAAAKHLLRFGVFLNMVERSSGAWAGDQQIEISNRFLASPQTTGSFDTLDALELPELGDQFIRDAAAKAQSEIAPRFSGTLRWNAALSPRASRPSAEAIAAFVRGRCVSRSSTFLTA